MRRSEENANGAKYSNVNARSTHETGKSNATLTLQVSNPYSIVCFTDLLQVLQGHFDVEKNAKNKAYSYILSKGLLNDFSSWSHENHYDDSHDACKNQLSLIDAGLAIDCNTLENKPYK